MSVALDLGTTTARFNMRHNSLECPPTGRSIRIVLQDQEYDATFTVDGPTVTVHSVTLGVRVALVGDNTPEVLAKLLLAELVYRAEASLAGKPGPRDEQIGTGLINDYAWTGDARSR